MSDRDRLEVHDQRVHLILRDRIADDVEPSALRRLYEVTVPADFADLATFHVAVFERQLWVIPSLTAGELRAFELLRAEQPSFAGFYRARLSLPPWRWRMRIFGIPLFPIVGLHLQTSTWLPTWLHVEGPTTLPACAALALGTPKR